jgi:hypothetical protein
MLNFADKPLVDFKSPFGDSKIFNNFLSESDMVAAFLSIYSYIIITLVNAYIVINLKVTIIIRKT